MTSTATRTDDTAAATYATATASATAPVPAALTADGPGTHTLRVRVLDKDGASNVYSATLTVANVKPTAKLADVTVDEGKVATVGPTDVADAGDAATVRYIYDLDGNATDDTAAVTYANALTTTTATVPANLTADGPATVPVRVRVIDKDGDSNVYTADVDVDNVDPTATLAGVTTVEGTPATVAFTGADDVSAADKAAGFTFEWDADGDGTFTPGTGSITVPAPDGPSERTIKGAILDRDGGRTEYQAKLTITNAAPTATITGPDAVPSSGATTLTLNLADTGDDTLSSVLDWGDGTTDAIDGAGEKTVNHTYSTPGAKAITLVATDSDGAKSDVATHSLTVAAALAAPAPADDGHAAGGQAGDHGREGHAALPARRRPAGQDRQDADDEGALLARRGRAGEVHAPAPVGQGRRLQVPAGPRRQAPGRQARPGRLPPVHEQERDRQEGRQHRHGGGDRPQGQAPGARHVPADRRVRRRQRAYEALGARELALTASAGPRAGARPRVRRRRSRRGARP